ncbi:MAG TPA: hypothetical protein VEH56_04985 [Candidatus Saccharimonadales bacterium]|nr:hypothetical protein [Candidatus Saccharimonadales bacterium]
MQTTIFAIETVVVRNLSEVTTTLRTNVNITARVGHRHYNYAFSCCGLVLVGFFLFEIIDLLYEIF